MAKFQVADNMDLLYILQEFETYCQIKFHRQPKLIRRSLDSGPSTGSSKSSIRSEKGSLSSSSSSSAPLSRSAPSLGSGGKPRKLKPLLNLADEYRRLEDADSVENGKSRNDAPPPARKLKGAGLDETKADSALDLQMMGTAVGSKPAPAATGKATGDPLYPGSSDPFSEHQSVGFQRLMKAVPFAPNTEFRELAAIISRDIYQENPCVRFSDIAGLDTAKSLIREAIVFPMKYPELFHPPSLLGPWRGLLLYGPPGTGKTLLAKAIATECGTTFFHVSASSLVSKWRGESEKLVRVLFELARHHAPSTIFMDEVESIMSHRGSENGEHEGSRRMKTELLVQLDGMTKSHNNDPDKAAAPVFFLAATNLPWDLDIALLRRLEKRILVDLPTTAARECMFRAYLPQTTTDAFGNLLVDSNLDYGELARITDGYTGADLKLVSKEALMVPLRQILDAMEDLHLDDATARQPLRRAPVTDAMVLAALGKLRPCCSAELLDKYASWADRFAST
ncbi:Katanin p60 ATPase-containing subunit A-like 2 [Allomyces arbusculus]|nr:Katanin p60 ATPase-containing subunit A-like 2 [Allomyces arbusculus]